ncbi:MAG: endonuclease III [Ignavibacteriaceae bacterium]|nr:endonuclease III [Ignavibacteriaceae bacterium]
MKEEINTINKLLVAYFKIPSRPKKLPNPIDALIATILSQNTNDRNSFQAYQNLKEKYKSIDELANAPRSEIEKVIRVAGLGKQKSASIKSFLITLKKKNGKLNLQHIRKMSDDEILDELTSIKGIGVKTASCVLLFSLDRNVCPVDTHVHRTLNRIGLVKTNTPDKTFEHIKNELPDGIAHQFHTNLIKLGREICKPAKPNCSICPLLQICNFKKKNFEIPQIAKNNSFLLLDSI